MERLTEKAVGCFEYALKDHKAVPGEFGTYEAFFDYSMAVKRLGHYEDTGLEPVEIKNALDVNDIIPEINVTVDRIRELIHAEQDGRLVVLPVRTKETVYVVGEKRIMECFIADAYRQNRDEFLRWKHSITANTVSVTRCRDCHCYTPVDEHTGKCVFFIGKHQYVVPDGYCYLGEKKEGADNA